MPCYQPSNLPPSVTTTGRTSYRTEAECNQACKEGACCEGTTCTVKPQCQCQGAGQVFKGVGTTCTSGLCECKCEGSPSVIAPSHIYATLTGGSPWDGTYVLDRMGNASTSVIDCYTSAGFNWNTWNSEGSFFRGRLGSCCTAYYTFFYGSDGCTDKPIGSDTALTQQNTADGWILITPYMSSIVLPFRRQVINDISCWWSPSTSVGPDLLDGQATYCSEQWSVVSPPQLFGGYQVSRNGLNTRDCPRDAAGNYIQPTKPTITFHV